VIRRIFAVAALTSTALHAQSAPNPRTNIEYARTVWREVRGYLLESVRIAPDSLFGYRPTASVRTFAETLDHVAASELGYCQMALGSRPAAGGAGTGARTRAQLQAVFDSASVVCTQAYNQSETAAGQVAYGSTRTTRLHVLLTNVAHDNEHYGGVVTYLRIHGIVPPSSRPNLP
jgi:uncharacterized damage-inducible protein DinB